VPSARSPPKLSPIMNTSRPRQTCQPNPTIGAASAQLSAEQPHKLASGGFRLTFSSSRTTLMRSLNVLRSELGMVRHRSSKWPARSGYCTKAVRPEPSSPVSRRAQAGRVCESGGPVQSCYDKRRRQDQGSCAWMCWLWWWYLGGRAGWACPSGPWARVRGHPRPRRDRRTRSDPGPPTPSSRGPGPGLRA
jgi:hypothetical protein